MNFKFNTTPLMSDSSLNDINEENLCTDSGTDKIKSLSQTSDEDESYLEEVEGTVMIEYFNLMIEAENIQSCLDNIDHVQILADKLKKAAKENYSLAVAIKWFAHMKMMFAMWGFILTVIFIFVLICTYVFYTYCPNLFNDEIDMLRSIYRKI